MGLFSEAQGEFAETVEQPLYPDNAQPVAKHPGVEHARRLYDTQRENLTGWQAATEATAIYPDSFNKELSKLIYCALGLNGEAGEVADEIKKVIRNDNGIISPERREKLKLELGDVGWYWLRIIEEAGFTVEEVMAANVEKLQKRYEHR